VTTTADLAPDQQIALLLPPGFSEYRSVIVFNRDGHLTAAEIRRYLEELVGLLGMTLAASPGIVTGWCEHGLAGWAHITTSGIELMGYPQPDGTETVTVGINSCRDYDLDAAAALTATTFDVADRHIATVRVLTLLG
jgi:hypothetical protein